MMMDSSMRQVKLTVTGKEIHRCQKCSFQKGSVLHKEISWRNSLSGTKT